MSDLWLGKGDAKEGKGKGKGALSWSKGLPNSDLKVAGIRRRRR